MPGTILRVKQGYNPNSSSMGSIIFALPVSMIALSFAMATISGIILPYFIEKNGEDPVGGNPSRQPEKENMD
jgi:hypothetical protein